MCGIAGVLANKNAADETQKILQKIKHRGPDAEGVHTVDTNAAIGMCHLRVRNHKQDLIPFVINKDIVAGFNGEVYGTLDEGAEASDFSPAGGVDEVKTIMAESQKKNHVDGMYAVAIADHDKVEIKRDPYGIKPLFYKEDQQGLVFCSELPPLVSHPKHDINVSAFDDLLMFGHMLNDQTIYKTITRLPLTAEIHYKAGQIHHIKKPIFEYQLKQQPAIDTLIAHSVKKCMLSARPVGLSVSSGLDSRILAYELNAQGFDNIKTVSILIDDVDDGIENLAQLQLPGALTWHKWQHFTTTFQASDFAEYLKKAVLCLGQPTRMTSFPLYVKLAELTRNAGLTVLLSGEGADEIFLGYDDYLAWQPQNFTDIGTAILNFYLNEKQQPLIVKLLGQERVAASIKRFKNYIQPFILKNAPYKSLLKVEQNLRLAALLERADLCMMKYSIEGRVPYLHGGIPEHVSLLPEADFFHATQSKFLLRKAYADKLPTLTIPKKRFRIPIMKWLKEDCYDWAMDLISSSDNGLAAIDIKTESLAQIFEEASPAAMPIIFTLLSYILWYQHFERYI